MNTKKPITQPFLATDQKEEKNLSMLKSGIPNMIPEKNVLLVIDGLREKKCFSSKKIFYLKHNLRHNK